MTDATLTLVDNTETTEQSTSKQPTLAERFAEIYKAGEEVSAADRAAMAMEITAKVRSSKLTTEMREFLAANVAVVNQAADDADALAATKTSELDQVTAKLRTLAEEQHEAHETARARRGRWVKFIHYMVKDTKIYSGRELARYMGVQEKTVSNANKAYETANKLKSTTDTAVADMYERYNKGLQKDITAFIAANPEAKHADLVAELGTPWEQRNRAAVKRAAKKLEPKEEGTTAPSKGDKPKRRVVEDEGDVLDVAVTRAYALAKDLAGVNKAGNWLRDQSEGTGDQSAVEVLRTLHAEVESYLSRFGKLDAETAAAVVAPEEETAAA